MGKYEDLTNKRFGRLVAINKIEPPESDRERRTWWHCKCDCGNEIDVRAKSLKRGDTKSCGCILKEIEEKRRMNLTGQRFGRLTVIEESDKKCGKRVWHCRCDCGKEKDVLQDALVQGKQVSCGCYKNELAKRECKDRVGYINNTNVSIISKSENVFSNNTSGVRGVSYNIRTQTYPEKWARINRK